MLSKTTTTTKITGAPRKFYFLNQLRFSDIKIV